MADISTIVAEYISHNNRFDNAPKDHIDILKKEIAIKGLSEVMRNGGTPSEIDGPSLPMLVSVITRYMNTAVDSPSKEWGNISYIVAARDREEKKDIIARTNVKSSIKLEPNCNRRCVVCEKKTVNYQSIQTRSGDEPSTLFFKCVECGASWNGK